ncbi:MAG: hypothetical protein IT442_08480 [Phycisphaeraceae bacterium]|nr:hypothetical protein [Phycisphaeraceae bacterium]
MRIKRIELEGRAGHVAIERERGSSAIHIDSILRDAPERGEQAWMTWELSARIDDEELFKVAQIVQRRCDGVRGTGGDIDGYFRELQRFLD